MGQVSREVWSKRVARWQTSGLSAADFADSLGVSAASLKWWKWRLSAASKPKPKRLRKTVEKPAVTFVELAAPLASDAPFELVLPSSLVVRIRAGFDERTLSRLLDALAARR